MLEHDPGASDDVRLIMMPGVDHCLGGTGPDWVNYLDEIDKWVVSDEAPEQLTAYWRNEQFQPTGSRLGVPIHRLSNTAGRVIRETRRPETADSGLPSFSGTRKVRLIGRGQVGADRVSQSRQVAQD